MSVRNPRKFAGVNPREVKLPSYPEHYAATSVGKQVEHHATTWRTAAKSLRDEIQSAESAIVLRLAEQAARDAARHQIRELAKRGRRL